MEFKANYCIQVLLHLFVDIATEWNLKFNIPPVLHAPRMSRYSNRMEFKVTSQSEKNRRLIVDIATEWNLKKAEEQVLQTKNKVDIETEWNLKN